MRNDHEACKQHQDPNLGLFDFKAILILIEDKVIKAGLAGTYRVLDICQTLYLVFITIIIVPILEMKKLTEFKQTASRSHN